METSIEMPKYQSHKKVWALKISKMTEPDANAFGRITLSFKEEGYADIKLEEEDSKRIYEAKMKHPHILGYYVVYEGGYKSWSPTDAFEGGYSLIK